MRLKRRLLVVFLLATFLFVAILGRLLYVEVIQSETLKAKALDQWTRDIALQARRGMIYDKNGIVLADTSTTYTVYVRPVSVSDAKETASVLSRVLGVNYDKLYSKMETKVSEITVKKQVTKAEMTQIYAAGITGVYFAENVKRVYPYGDFLTQVLGFTNVDGKGQAGLEAYYNEYLTGKDGYILTETDLVGRELASNRTSYFTGTAGNSLYLTIDQRIQSFVEQEVAAAQAEYNAKAVTCIVMDPATGGIVALAETPSFDLNNVPREDVAALFASSKSRAVSSVYEPGSTFKILTTAMGLETGKIDRNYRFFCPGYRIVDGQCIRCWRTIGHGSETFDEGVRNSCNCLFMDIAARVGVETFYDYIDGYGLRVKTGIDLVGEASGLTIAEENVKTVDLARIGFGQAIAVTPISLLTAIASVINGGTKVTPHFMERIEDAAGNTTARFYKNTGERIISAATSSAMREILQSVVDVGGGKNAHIDGYSIGGKTGTAQKYENGVIAQGKYVSSFVGFLPADNPQYLALFIVDEPEGYVYYGSMVAAPKVKNIFQKIIDYREFKPTGGEVTPKTVMPDIAGMSVSDAVAALKSAGLDYEMSGEGETVTYQFPIGGMELNSGSIVLINVG